MMPQNWLQAMLGHLRHAARADTALVPSDGELLQRWVASRDQSAFELLVWRHGRLVLSVCRRLLRDENDIEDAFQATFLVLVRKASGILRHQAVASWLHMVAYRIALEARSRPRRVELCPPEEMNRLAASPESTAGADELRLVLDEEVNRLPEKYRRAFILCCLQGRTNEEAARELGRPVGTVLSRLSRARERLRERLSRRGLTPSVLAGALLANEASGAFRPALVHATVSAASGAAAVPASSAVSASAIALMEGVLKTMMIAKVKTAAVVALSLGMMGVGGMAGYQAVATAQVESPGPVSRATGTSSGGTDVDREIDVLRKELDANHARAAALRQQLERLERHQNELRTSNKARRITSAAPATATLPANMLQQKEALELAQLRVDAKMAELEAARAMADEARRRLEAMTVANSRVRGAVAKEDHEAGKTTLLRYTAETRVKEMELKEAELLLMQAKRRLAPATTGTAASTAVNPVSSLESRVHQLEEKVRGLERRLDQMPNRAQPAKTTTQP